MGKFKSELSELRAHIDTLDRQLLQLLKDRTDVVHRVGALKKEYGIRGSYIYPQREAEMLRCLLQEASGSDYPAEAVETLWRTLIGVATSVESPLTLSIFAPEGFPHTRPLAHSYFGRHIPATLTQHVEDIIAALKASPHTIAVVPGQQFSAYAGDPWWLSLARSRIAAKVFAAIPFVQQQRSDAEIRSFAIADVPLEATGQDITLLVARFSGMELAEIESVCSHAILDCGLPSAPITLYKDAALLEINGFLDADSAMFGTLRFKLEQHSANRLGALDFIGIFATPYFISDDFSE